MDSYLFFFGRSPELSEAELRAFFPAIKKHTETLYEVSQTTCLVNGKPCDTPQLLPVLGGTIKISRVITKSSEFALDEIIKYFSQYNEGHLDFGISSFTEMVRVGTKDLIFCKNQLEDLGIKSRFIEPRKGRELSRVAVEKQHVHEINIHCINRKYLLSETVALQDVDEWTRRDYGRPNVEPKLGMLPPKASRMVVNIALGTDSRKKTLLDPFVGMGTIVLEGMLRGAICMGSDTDEMCVRKAKENTIWLRTLHKELPPVTFFTSDATHVSRQIGTLTIDAIVTEPFMGTTALGEGKIKDPVKVKHILKGLSKLYIGCLRDWHTILKPKGVVVMAFPEIDTYEKNGSVKKVIDSCEMLGYTKLLGPLPYSRPKAKVRRMFYKFIKR